MSVFHPRTRQYSNTKQLVAHSVIKNKWRWKKKILLLKNFCICEKKVISQTTSWTDTKGNITVRCKVKNRIKRFLFESPFKTLYNHCYYNTALNTLWLCWDHNYENLEHVILI